MGSLFTLDLHIFYTLWLASFIAYIYTLLVSSFVLFQTLAVKKIITKISSAIYCLFLGMMVYGGILLWLFFAHNDGRAEVVTTRVGYYCI